MEGEREGEREEEAQSKKHINRHTHTKIMLIKTHKIRGLETWLNG